MLLLTRRPHPEHSDSSDNEESQQDLFTVRCTNSFTHEDYAEGWTLCQHCRPSEALISARASQISELAQEYIT